MDKTPFNWVGNKYKFLETINELVKGKQYIAVIDMFLGSGNILFNIDVDAQVYVGNDKIKLLPFIFKEIKENKYIYSYEDVEIILNKFERFSKKENYYTFRDYWNSKYLNDNFDKDFILETILLLKMCSNSMVRFNPKQGYFNQGFRGLGAKKEFFTETAKQQCVKDVNMLSLKMNDRNYHFTNGDFIKHKDIFDKSLYILDPPYLLRSDMYDTDWSKIHEDKLNQLLKNTTNDFIYFNYTERDGVVNKELMKIIKDNNLRTIEINNKTLAGQGRSENIIDVKEVIITNIK